MYRQLKSTDVLTRHDQRQFNLAVGQKGCQQIDIDISH